MKQSNKAPNQPIKKITLTLTDDFLAVRELLTKASNSHMTYNQTITHLCQFYLIRTHQAKQPCTVWVTEP
jgi:hypothetical protein